MSRPHKPIDWKRVERLLVCGCEGTEIAAVFDMHPVTFYRRVEEQYCVSFTEVQAEKRQHGKTIIREKQMEAVEKGNIVMMIWLGKQLLGQKEKVDTATMPEDLKQMVQLIRDCIHPPQLSASEKVSAEDRTD